MIRTFDSGGIRDTGGGKIEYYGFRHPLLEHSFGCYMKKHQKMKDGSMRESNNWWKGWDTIISLQSLNRHVEDLNALHAGLYVYKERVGTDEITHVLLNEKKDLPENWHEVNFEDTLSAIRFNADSYKLQYLKENAKRDR